MGNWLGSQFSYYNPGCQICELSCLGKGKFQRKAGSQRGNDRVSGAGDIEHFSGSCRNHEGGIVISAKNHSPGAPCNQEPFQPVLAADGGGALKKFLLALLGSTACDQLQFGGIRGDAGRTLVTGPVCTFGINQNRDAANLAKVNEMLAKIRCLKNAFSVVRQNDNITFRGFLLKPDGDFLFQLQA